jgi:putative transposase
LFSYPCDYRAFLRYLARGLRKHPCEVNALALMTNHVHLLLTPPTAETIPKLIHYAAMRYAQVRNARHRDTGKLFEARFLSFPVLSERQLAIVTAYIELNPVRACACHDPIDYRWSTYALHVGGECDVPRSMWTPSDWFLSLGDDCGRRYAEWVAECRARDFAPERADLVRARELVSQPQPDRRLRRPDERRAS